MGDTALMKAAVNGRREVAKLLVDAGADMNEKDNVSYEPPSL